MEIFWNLMKLLPQRAAGCCTETEETVESFGVSLGETLRVQPDLSSRRGAESPRRAALQAVSLTSGEQPV
ncbi:hypothetical protein EYF80_060925 [Liparis tanakae]|uniref:Uncharacterized protein n=1 Tax=Liparis tanakae TaxID=230148 RepID=A0A4Z2EJ01_9TELE|nr:hypothetical protein EYF80_060925 [Liparis tanakae]